MLTSDRNGFLVGEPLDDDGAERLLRGVKTDTGRILALLMRGGRERPAARPVAPAGRAAAREPASSGPAPAGRPVASAPAQRVAVPVSRAARADADPARRHQLRGADGRFISRAQSDPPRAAEAMTEVARAAAQIARTSEDARRDEKADAALRRPQDRGADGRFAGGGRDDAGLASAAGRVLTGLGAGGAMGGAERVDPLIGAAGEIREVVAPLGRAAGALMGRSGEPEDVGLLRKLWRDLRGLRRESLAGDRATRRGLKDVQEAALASRDGGGGILSTLASVLPAAVAPVIATVGGIASKIGGLLGGVRGALVKIPVVGGLIEAGIGVAKDRSIASDPGLTDTERTQKRAANAGGAVGALGGMAAGAAAGSLILPGVGTVIGGAIGGYLGSKAGGKIGEKTGQLGWVSERFESGGRGVETISSGKGDHGGVSYGKHQLSSKTGTMQRFLDSSGYGAQFAGLKPGTREFNAKYREVVKTDGKAFGDAQHAFMVRSHFEPVMRKLQAAGVDLSGRGEAVREAVFSTSTQYGNLAPGLIQKALAGQDVGALTDAQFVERLQGYKHQTVDSYFRSSSPAVRDSIRNRTMAEKGVLLALANPTAAATAVAAAAGAPGAPTSPRVAAPVVATAAPLPAVPKAPAPTLVGAAPAPDAITAPVRLNTQTAAAAAPAPPAAPVGQDVRDRTIAHVVTGGIGGAGPRGWG